MDSRLSYIFSPSTLISIVSVVIGRAIAWAGMKNKVDRLEEKVKKIDDLDLNARLTAMQKDIEYMRERFDEYIRNK